MHTPRTLVSVALVALGLAIVPLAPASGAAQQVEGAMRSVVVVVEGLRNDNGELVGGLYDHASTWLVENHATENCHAPIHAGRARCTFQAPATGTVAFAALHDEDHDGSLDRDLIGLPTEGYAFSNDVREPFGPPSFDAASFSPVRTSPFVVHVRYGI